MYAVIQFAGHQYKVKEGDKFSVNSLGAKEGEKVVVDKVLLTFDDNGKKVSLGDPRVQGASVDLKVLENKKDKKVRVFKMHPKKRYVRNKGHRQAVSVVEVVKVNVGGSKSKSSSKAGTKKASAKKSTTKKKSATKSKKSTAEKKSTAKKAPAKKKKATKKKSS